MSILSILLLTVAATTDSFIIGFNYGIKGVRIGNVSNGFIALLCVAGTFVSMLLGKLLGCGVSGSASGLIGGTALVLFGMYALFSTLRPKKNATARYSDDPAAVDKDKSNVIELQESLLIGLLLTLNNLGLGMGAGIAGISIVATPLACGICSFLFIGGGCFFGKRITNARLSFLLELTSAVVVLLLGIGAIIGL